VHFLGLNSSVLTPRGFRPEVHGPRAGVVVEPRRLWGADDVAALRDAPLVRVAPSVRGGGDDTPGATDDLVLKAVLALALAGVPVTGHGLPPAVRERLDPALLTALDAVTPETVRDPGERELRSLALRRRAWQVAGYRPGAGAHGADAPVLLVLLPPGELPSGELPDTLRQDLDVQVTPGLTVRHRQVPEGEEAERAVREEGAVYVTRMTPQLRYGPHHLADLVHALGHSGARVALSPRRFLPWHESAWLEDGGGPSEGPAEEGLPGGSVWYAVDGATEPAPAGEGYAVHGAGAVPVRHGARQVGPVGPADPGAVTVEPPLGLAPLRLHAGTPRVLDWHVDPAEGRPAQDAGEGDPGDRVPGPVEPSYFARFGSG